MELNKKELEAACIKLAKTINENAQQLAVSVKISANGKIDLKTPEAIDVENYSRQILTEAEHESRYLQNNELDPNIVTRTINYMNVFPYTGTDFSDFLNRFRALSDLVSPSVYSNEVEDFYKDIEAGIKLSRNIPKK